MVGVCGDLKFLKECHNFKKSYDRIPWSGTWKNSIGLSSCRRSLFPWKLLSLRIASYRNVGMTRGGLLGNELWFKKHGGTGLLKNCCFPNIFRFTVSHLFALA
jgi:hypothetical protein